MATLVFSARFVPNSSTPISADEFQVNADIFDGTGVFSGLDILIGDIVYLDAFASITAPNTIARYKVIAIDSLSPTNVDITLKWDDTGDVVDPAEITGSQGFISRPSLNYYFAWHAAPTLHTFSDYVVQYARNKELKDIIDSNLGSGGGGGGGSANLTKIMQNTSSSTIPAGKPVAKKADGGITLADSDSVDGKIFCGISAQSIAPSATGVIYLVGQNILGAISGLGFAPGDSVFLDESGGYVNSTSGFTGEDDVIWRIGIADCAEGLASTTAQDILMMTEKLISP